MEYRNDIDMEYRSDRDMLNAYITLRLSDVIMKSVILLIVRSSSVNWHVVKPLFLLQWCNNINNKKSNNYY
jgi:hypothetical protein